MILVIDIGNTTIAFTGIEAGDNDAGKADAGETAAGDSGAGYAAAEDSHGTGLLLKEDFSVLFEAKLPTETGKDTEKFLFEAGRLLGEYGIVFPPENSRNSQNGREVDIVAISSVVPAVTPAAACLAQRLCRVPPVIVSCRCDSGLSFERLPAPEKLGADRIADAAWAAARYPLPAMTADLGTATTINVIAPPRGKEASGGKEDGGSALSASAAAQPVCPDTEAKDAEAKNADGKEGIKGVFMGGMIGAGVRTSLRALRTGTAQLPAPELRPVPEEDLIGRDTEACMLSSAVVGTAALIEGLALRVEEQLGMPLTLILTGGNAGVTAPWIRRPFFLEPSLASKGTAWIALRELRKARETSDCEP